MSNSLKQSLHVAYYPLAGSIKEKGKLLIVKDL